jgi:hypothetical protein
MGEIKEKVCLICIDGKLSLYSIVLGLMGAL